MTCITSPADGHTVSNSRGAGDNRPHPHPEVPRARSKGCNESQGFLPVMCSQITRSGTAGRPVSIHPEARPLKHEVARPGGGPPRRSPISSSFWRFAPALPLPPRRCAEKVSGLTRLM